MGKNNRIRRFQKSNRKVKKQKGIGNNNQKFKPRNSSLGPVYHTIPNPFDCLSDAQRKEVIEEIAESSEAKYQESLSKIKKILLEYDPIILLSILANYGLTVGVGDNGVRSRDSDATLTQAHVEICQSLALQILPCEFNKKSPHPAIIQELWNALVDLTYSLGHRNFNKKNDILSPDETAQLLLQQYIRTNTILVRNWGYFFQVKRISKELYSRFDQLLTEHYGYSGTNIINLFESLIKRSENANTLRFKKFKNLKKLKNKEDLVHAYYNIIGESDQEAERFIKDHDLTAIKIDELFLMFLSHHDLQLDDNYECIISTLARDLRVEEAQVISLMHDFSLEFGELNSYDTEHIYLANPVWERPIIRAGNKKYFCVVPQTFFNFVLPSLNRLVDKLDKNLLNEIRSSYLEEKIAEIINKRFPSSNTICNFKWTADDVEYETDLLTFIDSHIIIVEAKSGKISDPAFRGAPKRLRKHIEEILLAPNEQSFRLKKRLESLIADKNLKDQLRSKLPVDLNNVHKILRLSVSLEDFGSIQANIAQLKKTGWLDEDFEPCPTMDLADLETLFDFLEHPVQILHYLERRQEIEDSVGYVGCELDLMGLYIGTLFNFGDIPPGTNMYINEMSYDLDVYYNSRSEGIDVQKPRPKISKLFLDIMNQLEKRQTPRWSEIGVILNRISPDDQKIVSNFIARITRSVKKMWNIEGHENMIISHPPLSSEFAFAFVLYCEKNKQMRDEFIYNAAQSGLEPIHVKKCLVVAKNIDYNDFPYHFIGLFERQHT